MERLRQFYRNRLVVLIASVCCLLALPQGVAAREYRTVALQKAALVLGIEQQIDNAGRATTTQIQTSAGKTVAVRLDDRGRVMHIGIPLFSTDMRYQKPSPVYDCLEYAALDRNIILSENDLQLQKIQFFKGSWATLMDVVPTDACSIGTLNTKFYQVKWSRNGVEIVNLVVPIDYELLSNSSRRELETNLVREMGNQHVRRPSFQLSEDRKSVV